MRGAGGRENKYGASRRVKTRVARRCEGERRWRWGEIAVEDVPRAAAQQCSASLGRQDPPCPCSCTPYKAGWGCCHWWCSGALNVEGKTKMTVSERGMVRSTELEYTRNSEANCDRDEGRLLKGKKISKIKVKKIKNRGLKRGGANAVVEGGGEGRGNSRYRPGRERGPFLEEKTKRRRQRRRCRQQ